MRNLLRRAWSPYSDCFLTDQAVSELDPLGLDGFFSERFREINETRDASLLFKESGRFMPSASILCGYSLASLGMIVISNLLSNFVAE